MEGIDNNYIEEGIQTLVNTLGIKENINVSELISLLHSKKTKECIKKIALYLGLPIEISLSYVPKNYRADSTDNFSSKDLTKTNHHGQGVDGITAQISIPSYLPFYGTAALNNFPISVKISENCLESPATFIAIIAHELSHIVLHSLWHKDKENEVYTDLTAMIMGFSHVMDTGRKVIKTIEHSNMTETQTTTYGYLSDSQFNFAKKRIEKVLSKYRISKNNLMSRTKNVQKKFKQALIIKEYFKKYIDFLDHNLNKKIPPEDGLKIAALHQAGYVDEFESMIKNVREILEKNTQFSQKLNHYNQECIGQMIKLEQNLQTAFANLQLKQCEFMEHVAVLKKYVSPIFRLKTFLFLSSYQLYGNF